MAWIPRIILILVLSLLPACGEDGPVYRVDLDKRQDMPLPKPEPTITYAYLPQYSHTVSFQRHHALIEYLNRVTGLRIRQVFPDTFEDHISMLGQGKIDISFSNPFAFVRMAKLYGAVAFARILESNGKPDFYGEIICRADNKAIETIQDCRGKTWIAVDPSSAGGYLYPLGFFYDHGLTTKDFAEIAFAPGPGGKQEKVVLAVYAGKYDIGSVRDGTLDVVGDKVDLNMIRVLARSESYPGWLYAHRRDLPPEVVDAVREALLTLDPDTPEHRLILEQAGFKGIIEADNADYEPVERLMQKLGLKSND
ncbi:MAG: phosphate/phosphite/phosphonate ABC transporter substrate-binding protein [Deltaproteobacteria bacterium]|nr:phosphate/phosphite/phosphonate ABC transporter substrate-binding protein [Deltaproteobacteria bacterium]